MFIGDIHWLRLEKLKHLQVKRAKSKFVAAMFPLRAGAYADMVEAMGQNSQLQLVGQQAMVPPTPAPSREVPSLKSKRASPWADVANRERARPRARLVVMEDLIGFMELRSLDVMGRAGPEWVERNIYG